MEATGSGESGVEVEARLALVTWGAGVMEASERGESGVEV
jgi:hypothetical protein